MAALQTIRNNAGKLVAIIIGLALFAFIIGDLLRSSSSFMRGDQMKVGEVNGDDINIQDYTNKINEITEMYKAQTGGGTIDDKTMSQIREQAWNDLITEYIQEDLKGDLGLDVTADELFDLVQGNNIHPIVQQMFRNPQTGQVDRSQVLNFLKAINQDNPQYATQKNFWLHTETMIAKDQLQRKYYDMISKAMYVTKDEAKEVAEGLSKQYSIDFVAKKYSEIADSDIKISDSDLKAYYDKHINSYKQEATRNIEYITFPIIATQEDINGIQKSLNELKDDFIHADDITSFVNMNSDVPFDNSYAKKSELSPSLAEFAFNSEENAVFGPYKEGNSYKIAKVVNFKMLSDSVKARHILLQPQSQEEATGLKNIADSLKLAIETHKATFADVAKQYSKDQASAVKGGELGWFKRGQMVKEFDDAAFLGKEGEIQVITTQYGLHIVQVEKQGPKTNNVQLAVISQDIMPSSATRQMAYTQASKFAGENLNAEAFNNTVKEEGLSKRSAVLTTNEQELPGLPSSRELIRSAFLTEDTGALVADNNNSAVFEFGDNYVVALLTGAAEKGFAPMSSVKNSIEHAVRNQKKASQLSSKLKGTDLNTIASNNSTDIQSADNLNFESYSIPNIGVEPKVLGTMVSLKKDQLSKPIEGNEGVYVLRVKDINEDSSLAVDDKTIGEQQKRLEMSNTYRAQYEMLNTLKKVAEVEDLRVKFY